MDYIKEAQNIISSKDGIIAAYGYGSSFFHQAGYNSKTVKSMDFIFVVDSLKEWLINDIAKNPEDYTENTRKKLLKLSAKKLKGRTGVIYNVVRDRKVNYKFGVIEKKDFIKHLSIWDSFYVTGRMQKPIYTFKSTKDLDDVINSNRENVLLTSLLVLNKEKLNVYELFEMLCSLSYKGDIRFIIENPNKVSNIVRGNIDELLSIYTKYDKYIKVDGENVLVNLNKVYSSARKIPNFDKFKNMKKTKYGNYLLKHIKHINRCESICQPLKGLRVSGLKDSLSYVKEKAKKKKLK